MIQVKVPFFGQEILIELSKKQKTCIKVENHLTSLLSSTKWTQEWNQDSASFIIVECIQYLSQIRQKLKLNILLCITLKCIVSSHLSSRLASVFSVNPFQNWILWHHLPIRIVVTAKHKFFPYLNASPHRWY